MKTVLNFLVAAMLALGLAGCGGGEADSVPASFAEVQAMRNPHRAPQPPQAAMTFDLADVQAYIRAFNLYDPRRIYEAAQVAGCRTAGGDQMVEAVQEAMLDFFLERPGPAFAWRPASDVRR